MKPKPYPPYDEEPMRAAEPAVDYRRTDPATYRHGAVSKHDDEEDDAAWEAFMNADLSELGEGFRPFTMAQLNRWMDEIEAEDEEDALPHEEVMREMRELIVASCHSEDEGRRIYPQDIFYNSFA